MSVPKLSREMCVSALRNRMEEISEWGYAASWMSDLELDLWTAVQLRELISDEFEVCYGMHRLEREDLDFLASFAMAGGAWAGYPESYDLGAWCQSFAVVRYNLRDFPPWEIKDLDCHESMIDIWRYASRRTQLAASPIDGARVVQKQSGQWQAAAWIGGLNSTTFHATEAEAMQWCEKRLIVMRKAVHDGNEAVWAASEGRELVARA